ncbi:oligopeptide ABC transporter substrate-binding protein [Streptococcus loxodontisalivarius]|uniref:Peptide/nickel transport system substrate-binding protein n=1 Tax=Streptococcus loxodontisalivarius TaxID=1349415 RepID=A0ABS2PTB8_9STRE|nr:oligopeptide ABC transporter substrate-binding protein [Streptococcus loxodontisalivarius]MBM7643235.1 peptide/nickel transport system substrate-binding protein [Streptococcus loxodontisalivarius]
MKKKTWKRISLGAVALLSTFTLVACGNSSSSSEQKDVGDFKTEVENSGTSVDNAQFKYAIVSSSDSTGILMDELVDQTVDSSFSSFVDESMFGYDGNRKLDDTGLAKVTFDTENNKYTVTLTGKDYKWSDGQAFTIDDYIYTIESMTSKDYTGKRYGTAFTNIVGAEEYHNGTATSISGLKKIDDYTVEVSVKEMTPSMELAGGDIPSYVTPKHIFKDIAVKDWETSDYARTNKFVGMGPFTVDNVVTGESITYKANPNYYKGTLKISSLKADIVSPDTIVSEVKAGKYDIASMPTDQYTSYNDLDNITLLGQIDSSYEYISFNFGKWDSEKGENVMNDNAKMNNVKLRQAIGYAIDNKTAGEKLYNGLYLPATTAIISFFGDLHDDSLKGYTYDPEKAEKLLDEAGYKDTDNDGYREDPDGKAFKISLAARTRTDANEKLIQQYIAWWKEVGLDVELYGGKTMELNAFYDAIQSNDSNIDMFIGGWSTGYDPNPEGTWGPKAEFNMSRYVNATGTEIMDKMNSKEAFDEKTNKELYDDWQEYVQDEAFFIPTFESVNLTAVNNRVKYWDTYLGSASKVSWEKVELVKDKGVSGN